jgi:hypothetical protein
MINAETTNTCRENHMEDREVDGRIITLLKLFKKVRCANEDRIHLAQ